MFAPSAAATSGASSSTREARSKEPGKILDEVTRDRRQKNLLDALEKDNFQEEPHADLVMSKKAPKFEETLVEPSAPAQEKRLSRRKAAHPTRRRRPPDYYKKHCKTFPQLLEEDLVARFNDFRYTDAQAGPSKYPPRKFCNVCGLPSPYTCTQCGVRYCTVKCFKTHQETRCLKWTA